MLYSYVDDRKIFPPMSWKHYAQMNDSDLKAIWVYLKTQFFSKILTLNPR